MKDFFKISRVRHEPYFTMDKPHYHTDYEIYYLLNGKRRFFIGDSIYNIKGGDAVVLPKGVIHRTTYLDSSSHERFNTVFSKNYIEDIMSVISDNFMGDIFSSHYIVSVPQSRQGYVTGIFERMYMEYTSGDMYSGINIKNNLQELVIFLIRCLNFRESYVTAPLDTTDYLMQEAARYISGNFNKELTLNDVAARVNMSPSYFSKKFKGATGFGFKEYLINLRLNKAALLLLETNLSVTDIAMNCGFNDSNYFGDIFRRIKGMSPLNYRKSNTMGG